MSGLARVQGGGYAVRLHPSAPFSHHQSFSPKALLILGPGLAQECNKPVQWVGAQCPTASHSVTAKLGEGSPTMAGGFLQWARHLPRTAELEEGALS